MKKILSLGTLLVVLGLLFLVENFGLISLPWNYIIKFWPIILIALGLWIWYSNKKNK